MRLHHVLPDLMPPRFADGLDDWSRTDGSPDSPTYESAENVRVPRGDPDFGTCLEVTLRDRVQRLRYMGEVPVLPGRFIEIAVRLKAVRGPLLTARVVATAGGSGGMPLETLPAEGRLVSLPADARPVALSAVLGPAPRDGVDLVWNDRARFARIGLDLIGPAGAAVRIEDLVVQDVTARIAPRGPVLPGFGDRP